MKKILFLLVTVLMGVMLFSSCANDDQLGVDKYNAYKENFEKVFARIHPGQNFNTQQTLTIQSTTGKQGNYTLRVYDGAPGKKSTSLLGKFENLNGTSVSTVKVGVSKSLKNIYCVADDGSTSRLATVKITPKGDAIPDFEDIPINIPTNGPTNANTVTIAFEDLGATDDFDFNDVVITVDYVTGARTATVTLLALGGVLPVRLSYVSRTADFSKELFEGKELHEAMGYDTKTMINTNCETTGGVTGVDNVAPITDEITVPADFNIAEDGAPFVIIVNDQEGQRQITADTEAGKTPQVLVLGKFYSEQGSTYSWVWPKEKTPINTAYPTITNWLQNNPDDISFIANPDEDQIYDAYNPNEGEEEDEGVPDGLQVVDLGLPSGTLWANMNIGANNPWDFGGYYAWGETKTKDEYLIDNYIYADGNEESYHYIGDDIAGTEYDVAHVKWGNGWQTPSRAQFIELLEWCTEEWVEVNGVKGFKYTGENGNSIFLPAACYYWGGWFSNNESGYYMSSTFLSGEGDPKWGASYALAFNSYNENAISIQMRYTGFPVRPVKAGTSSIYQAIDLGLPSGTKWANMNVDAQSPEENGGYYAWGEYEEKNYYSLDNYRLYEIGYFNGNTFLKDTPIPENIAGTDWDVVHVKWGGDWTMPTYEQFKELIDNCETEHCEYNNVIGCKFTAKNGNSIFLPFAGLWWGDEFRFFGESGNYWLSNRKSSNSVNIFGSTPYLAVSRFYDGLNVRPVKGGNIKPRNIQAIDLNLPSGTKWANMNVGATAPEDYGAYYAWGERWTKNNYVWDNYQFFHDATFEDIGSDIAGSNHDVATSAWGQGWKMPTVEQFQELIDNCEKEWVTINKINGVKFTASNGNSIFLPAAGNFHETLDFRTTQGYYWTSMTNPNETGYAYNLFFEEWSESPRVQISSYYRLNGRSIRPVTK